MPKQVTLIDPGDPGADNRRKERHCMQAGLRNRATFPHSARIGCDTDTKFTSQRRIDLVKGDAKILD